MSKKKTSDEPLPPDIHPVSGRKGPKGTTGWHGDSPIGDDGMDLDVYEATKDGPPKRQLDVRTEAAPESAPEPAAPPHEG